MSDENLELRIAAQLGELVNWTRRSFWLLLLVWVIVPVAVILAWWLLPWLGLPVVIIGAVVILMGFLLLNYLLA